MSRGMEILKNKEKIIIGKNKNISIKVFPLRMKWRSANYLSSWEYFRLLHQLITAYARREPGSFNHRVRNPEVLRAAV